MKLGAPSGRQGRRPDRIATLTVAIFLLMGVAAPSASATLRIENHTDPAGDPTVMTYRVSSAIWTSGDFTLDAIEWYRSFGQPTGTYVAQAELPAGWQVADIQCIGAGRPGEFTVDIPNARVTIAHDDGDEQTCAFTHRRTTAAGPPAPGVSPSLPAAQLAKTALPNRPALVRVVPGRRFVDATVRVTRRSVIRGQLLWHKTHIVGSARVVHRAGTYTVRVALSKAGIRLLRAHHVKRATLTLRIVVVGDNKVTHVFKLGALVRV